MFIILNYISKNMGIIKFIKKAIKYLYRETVLYAIWHFSSYFPYFRRLC